MGPMTLFSPKKIASFLLLSFLLTSSAFAGKVEVMRFPTGTPALVDLSGGGGTIGGPVVSGTPGSVLFVGTGPVLAQDNANFFYDVANHRLGIGTPTPAYNLEIKQNQNGLTGVYIHNDTNGDSASAFFECDSATGGIGATTYPSTHAARANTSQFFCWGTENFNFASQAAAGYFTFYTKGGVASYEKMRLDTNGYLGIGTTTPAGILNTASFANSGLGGDNLIYADDYSNNNGNTNYWFSRKSHNAGLGVMTQTTDGEYLGVFYFQGVNSSAAFGYGAGISVIQDGTAGATYVPTRLVLNTYSASGQNTNQLLLLSNGKISHSSTIYPNILSAASYTTNTGTSINCDTQEMFIVTAQTGALKFNNPAGTPADGQKLIISVASSTTTARALTWDTGYGATTVALPTTTAATTVTLTMGFIYSASKSLWQCVAVA